MSFNQLVGLFEVEVAIQPNVWVKGYVKNIFDDSIIVSFDNGLSTTKFNFSNCRMPKEATEPVVVESGAEIEILVELKEEGVKGWARTIVEDIRGEFFTVRRIGVKVDLKPSYVQEEARGVCPNGPMSSDDEPRYHYLTVNVPTSLQEGVQKAENMAKLKEACKSETCLYYNEQDGHIYMITADVEDIERMKLLMSMHFRFVQKENKLDDQIRSLQSRLLKADEQMSDLVLSTFSVETELIRYVIGQNGRNINKVRALPGIVNIHVNDDSHTVMVYAKDADSAGRARSMLDFEKQVFIFDRKYAPRVFGTDNANIRKVVDRSNVVQLNVTSSQNDEVILKLVGVTKSVNMAITMLGFILNAVKSIEHQVDDIRSAKKLVGNGQREGPENVQYEDSS